jgi:hypothetical protein
MSPLSTQIASVSELLKSAYNEGHEDAMNACAATDERRTAHISELLTALQDLRMASTEAYKHGRIPAEPFVRAGNLIANARVTLSAFGPCVRCEGSGLDPENGTDSHPEPKCERCGGTGDEGDAPAKPRQVQVLPFADCQRLALKSQAMREHWHRSNAEACRNDGIGLSADIHEQTSFHGEEKI